MKNVYREGLFWLVNPDDYNVLGRKFPNISENAIFFARTGIGNLFLWRMELQDKILIISINISDKLI
ncbi:GAD-like domain-containing protein [Flavobacterium sp. UBA7682]|uniref:GAD-like domain-containing protein n=1 Tax=Flavobacterium sp. UBA7682 TaxID=1946560 RepID=UPI0039C88798